MEGDDADADFAAGAALRPVDVDVNLVAGLLASYREQGGLPGPAGSLAALMGVPLPAARCPLPAARCPRSNARTGAGAERERERCGERVWRLSESLHTQFVSLSLCQRGKKVVAGELFALKRPGP